MSFVNEASWDRVARIVAGIVLPALGLGVVGGTGGIVMTVVGLVLLVTGLVGFCPIYRLLNVSTARSDSSSTIG